VDAVTIDRINILQATMRAMAGAVQQCVANANTTPAAEENANTTKKEASSPPTHILVDGNRLPQVIHCTCLQ
jgi:ribonuclease HII